MQKETIETEILNQCLELMEKSCYNLVSPLPIDEMDYTTLENTLIYLRTLNARFDKAEAISQIQGMMSRYNIQLDQLVTRHGL